MVRIIIEIDGDDVKIKRDETKPKRLILGEGYSVSLYARHFDGGCSNWCKDHKKNHELLVNTQFDLNQLLKSRKYVFLNEVYDRLGIQRTIEGNVVGWIYDKENPIGDNFIKLDIIDTDDDGSILIDFNVDGKIIDRV